MSFQIHPLAPDEFRPLFLLSDDELREHNARRVEVTNKPGFPCRVSLEDAEVGETVILLNYEHQPERSPFRASHAIFVRDVAEPAQPAIGQVPQMLRSRLTSVRAFDRDHEMIDADVVEGSELEGVIERLLANSRAEYLHLHNAKLGCFTARATRALPR